MSCAAVHPVRLDVATNRFFRRYTPQIRAAPDPAEADYSPVPDRSHFVVAFDWHLGTVFPLP